MIPASAAYLAYEALEIGAMPVVRATFYPYDNWPTGVDAEGTFVHFRFVPLARIQGDYVGASGSWISDPILADLQIDSSPVVITFDLNPGAVDVVLYFRAAPLAEMLEDAEWAAINSGDTINIQPCFQFKLTAAGFRCWAEDDIGGADEFTAYAIDTEPDDYASYAAEGADDLTYLENMVLLGEFTVQGDIMQAGSLTLEAPDAFDDLVAGEHSGLELNNRQGSFATGAFVPAPRYSPNKASFLFAGQEWRDKLLKIELGWSKGGWFAQEFGADEWMAESYSDFITLFTGRIKNWDTTLQPHTATVYAVNMIMDCLEKRIALPQEDGTPNPRIDGEFLYKAEPISGWTPEASTREATFENNDYSELTAKVESGGGAVSLITPGLSGSYSFRAQVTGAGQSAYGSIVRSLAGEMFVTGIVSFTSIPVDNTGNNMVWFDVRDAAGNILESFTVDAEGYLYSNHAGQTKFQVAAYENVPLIFAYWIYPTANGYTKLWINGDEVQSYEAGNITTWLAAQVRFGAWTGGSGQSWTIDFDDIRIYPKYYNNAFRVYGAPFASLGAVYIDKMAQPDSKTVQGGTYTQTLTRYPDTGVIYFESTDPDFSLSGEVMCRVVKHAGGRHPLTVLEELFAEAGLTAYLDAPALAAAYLAVPNDLIHNKFEGGSVDKQGLKDYDTLGITIGEAIKEICSRCLYWVFMDAETIKIIPYTGIPAADGDVVLELTASRIRDAAQANDLSEPNDFVSSIYGWYDRNPSLFYVAGTQGVGKNGTSLDFSWNSAVASESRDMVQEKTDLFYKFLGPKESFDPVRLSLWGARAEVMDVVKVSHQYFNDNGINYRVKSKEVTLDKPKETNLTLQRYLGET